MTFSATDPFFIALRDNPGGLASCLAIKFDQPASGLILQTSWMNPVEVEFKDPFVHGDTEATKKTFEPTDASNYAFPQPTDPLANDIFHVNFLDNNSVWLNRFRIEPRGVPFALWWFILILSLIHI